MPIFLLILLENRPPIYGGFSIWQLLVRPTLACCSNFRIRAGERVNIVVFGSEYDQSEFLHQLSLLRSDAYQ